MFQNSRSFVLGSVLALCAACGPDNGGGRARMNPGQDPTSNGPSPDMAIVEFDGGYSDKCGVQDFMLQPGLPPEMMLVVDRSGSMSTDFDGGTRWSKVADAVKSVVAALQAQVSWGLTVYPTDDDCGVSSTVAVPVAAMNAAPVSMKLDSYSPGGNTPTWKAVETAAANMSALTSANPKYLLLTSDGEPNCGTITTTCTCLLGSPNAMGQCCVSGICTFGNCVPLPTDDGVDKAVQKVTDAANQGIHTFVIGVAADGAAGDALNKLADAGKEAATGATKYYAVASAADLVTAINTITGQIISCSFALSTPPPSDLSLVEVNLNGTVVPQDATHANGWDFGPGNHSIQFYGTACQNLQTATGGTAVQAIYHCPPTL